MNKKVSKALAAVLSAAMAASAFAMSTSASFAAPNISISVDPIEVSLTTESTNYDLDGANPAVVESGTVAANQQIEDAIKAKIDDQNATVTFNSTVEDWTSSNEKLATIDSDGVVTIEDKSITTRQEVTFTKTVKVNISNYENGKHDPNKGGTTTAEVKVSVTAAIYPTDAVLVLPVNSSDENYYRGYEGIPDSNVTVSVNEPAKFGVYTLSTSKNKYALFTKDTTSAYTFSAEDSDVTIDSTSGEVEAQDADNVKLGSTVITAENATTGEEAQSASITVEDTYLFGSSDAVSGVTVDDSYGQETKTMIGDYNVTGMDVIVDGSETLKLEKTDAKAVLGNISGAGKVEIQAGTVGDIDVDGTVSIGEPSSASTGDKAATVGNVVADGAVTITGSDEAEGPAVTVGNVTGSGDVTVTAKDTTKNGQTVGAGDVTVGNIVAKGAVELSAGENINTMSLGSVSGVEGNYTDCPYPATLEVSQGTFNLGDLLYFGSVTIGKDANVTAGDIDTGVKTDSGDGCAESASALTVEGRLTVDSIKVNTVSQGDGTIIAPVNSVEVTGTTLATGTTLLVEDARVGDILYTSTESNDNMFLMPGVTAMESEDSGLNIYTYTVTGLEFRGVLMEQTGTVEVGTAGTTLSVVKIPFTTDLPEGVTIEWKASKDSVTLTPSADGLSCAVAATGYTENNIGDSNNVTVTASLYKDGKPYSELDTQYASTSVDLTLTNAAPEAPANPFSVVVTNAEGEEITCAADGSTVITVPQSMAFNFAISSEETQPFDYTVGDGSIGGTNTNTVWNGTSGSYQIYAAGAVGAQTGVYVNGIKIFTLEVGDRPFESDTTINMDLKVGQKYQFEITLDDPTADFTFKTADGAALSTSYNPDTYPAENGKYYCSVTAQQAGRDIGVYCEIDGKTYKIFTAHTIA